MESKLTEWIEKFNQLQGIRAKKYDGDDPDSLVTVILPGNFKTFTGERTGTDATVSFYTLYVDGTFKETYWDGESDKLYSSWENDLFSSDASTWEDFFVHLEKLVNLFQKTVS